MRWPTVTMVERSNPAYYTLDLERAFACASGAEGVLLVKGGG